MFLGFGIVLALLCLISIASTIGLVGADRNFKSDRALARQTNADGRVQANMLMTRLLAKDFVITASRDDIELIQERAEEIVDKGAGRTREPSISSRSWPGNGQPQTPDEVASTLRAPA